MFCPKCGQEVADGSTFCTHCGASLKAAGAPVPAAGGAPASVQPLRPDMTQAMPVVSPAPQKTKSKTPIIVAVACAAVVLIGGGTVFALTALGGSNGSSDTQISKVDTGSSEEKASSDKSTVKKKSAKKADTSSSSDDDDESNTEDEALYYADRQAGSVDSEASLSEVHTYTNDRFGYSMSIPSRFRVIDVPTNSGGLTYEDPDTDFDLELSAYANANGESASELLGDEDTSGKDDLYTAKDADWYVVSWRDDDTIYYNKTFVSDSAIVTASLQYSTSNRDMGTQLIDSLLPTFKFN